MSTPPHQKSGKTTPVRSASTTNPGDSAMRHKGGGKGVGALGPLPRASGRVVKGANPGVNVGSAGAGNGHSNAMMVGYPHKNTKGRSGTKNITSTP